MLNRKPLLSHASNPFRIMGRIMAKLDDLIAHVGDAGLRRQLEEAAVELRRRKKFGLVFEQHIPETTMFPSETVQKGSVVMIRTEPSNKTRYVVDSVTKTTASISAGEEAWTIPVAGEYDDGTPMAEGFPENATFFDLVYADPDAIDVGAEFDDIVPALWMAAGCQGNPADLEHDAGMAPLVEFPVCGPSGRGPLPEVPGRTEQAPGDHACMARHR